MKKTVSTLLALLLTLPLWAADGGARTTTLVSNFDLDGAAASATAVHSADAITDAASFTIDAQPDTPRLLVATLTDGDSSISACTYTVVGTNAQGATITTTATLTGGSGAKTLATTYYFATVTSASVGTCTGEGVGDTVSLGTSGNPPTQYFVAYGAELKDSQGYRRFSPWEWFTPTPPVKVKTTGSSASLTSNTASSGALTPIGLWDILRFVGRTTLEREIQEERGVFTDTDDDNVVLDAVVDLTDGYYYKYKKHFKGPDSEDGIIPVGAFSGGTASCVFNVVQMGNNLSTFMYGRIVSAGGDWIQIDTDALTAAGTVISTVDLRTIPYDQVRCGLGWAANDTDGDTGAELEKITIQFVGAYPVK